MGQVTIYLEDEVEAQMRSAAKSQSISQSKWVARLIKDKVADEWPASVIELSGAWNDLPTLDQLRNTQVADPTRESF